MNNFINQKVKTKELYYKIDLARQYYSNKTGTIKGTKSLQHKMPVYLVEFFNHNRIWIAQEELDFATTNNKTIL